MSVPLKSRIQSDLNQARRARDKLRTIVLSSTLSEIRNHEIDTGTEASDDDIVRVVSKGIKQRRDAAHQMRAGGREELAAREDEEAVVLAAYMPAELDEAEVRAMIREVIASGADAMGSIMSQLMPRLRGRFDGKEANRLVREELDDG